MKTKNNYLPHFALIVAIFAMFGGNLFAQTTRYVTTTGADVGDCGNPNSPCATVNYAIGQSQNGDQIDVGPGNFSGFTLNKRLSVIAEGAIKTNFTSPIIVTAPGGGATDRVHLKDFTVKNGNTGLTLNASYVTVENVRSTNNTGNGIDINTANFTTFNDIFLQNCAVLDNGNNGLRVGPRITINGLRVYNTEFKNNAFGVYFQSSNNTIPATPTFVNDVHFKNVAVTNSAHRSFYLEKLADNSPNTNALFENVLVRQNTNEPAFQVNVKWADYSGLELRNSRISNGPDGRVFSVYPRNDNSIPEGGPDYSLQPASMSDIKVHGVIFQGGNLATMWGGNILDIPVVEYCTFLFTGGSDIFNFTGNPTTQQPGVPVNASRNYFTGQIPSNGFWGYAVVTDTNQVKLVYGLNTESVNIFDNLYVINPQAQLGGDTIIALGSVVSKTDSTVNVASNLTGGLPPYQGAVVGDTVAVGFTPEGFNTLPNPELTNFISLLNKGVIMSEVLSNQIVRLDASGAYQGNYATLALALAAANSGDEIINLPSGAIPGETVIDKDVKLVCQTAGAIDPGTRTRFVRLKVSGGNLTLGGDFFVENDLTVDNQLNLNGYQLSVSGLLVGAGSFVGNDESALVVDGSGVAGTIRFNAGNELLRAFTLNRADCGFLKLESDLRVTSLLNINNGRFSVKNGFKLSFDYRRVSNYTLNSYVLGKLSLNIRNAAQSNIFFPVGNAQGYKPLEIRLAGQTATTQYEAEAVLNSASVLSTNLTAPLTAVSPTGYWTVAASLPPFAVGKIRVNYLPSDGVAEPAKIRIAQLVGGSWTNLGAAGASPLLSTLSANVNLGAFALATETSATNLQNSIVVVEPLEASPVCAGSTINVPFRVLGVPINPTNLFTLELSDSAGDFTNAVVLDTLTGAVSDTLSGVIPINSVYSDNYQIRVVTNSNNVEVVAVCETFAIQPALSTPTISANGATQFCGNTPSGVTLSTPVVPGVIYVWLKDSLPVGANSPTYAPVAFGTYKVQLFNSCGGFLSDTSITLMKVPPINADTFQLAVNGSTTICTPGQTVQLSVSPADLASFKWFRNGADLGANGPVYDANATGWYKVLAYNSCGLSFVKDSVYIFVGDTLQNFTIAADGQLAFCADGADVVLSGPVADSATYVWFKDGVATGDTTASITLNDSTQSGVYTLQITTICGVYTSVNSLTADLYPVPAPVVHQSWNTVNSSYPTGNQWFDANGNILNGATGQSFSPPISGGYYVVVTSAEGCTGQSPIFNFGLNALDENLAAALQVYPNPADDQLTLQAMQPVSGDYRLTLINATGQTVFSANWNAGSPITIDLSHFAAGLYSLNLSADNRAVYSTKVVKR